MGGGESYTKDEKVDIFVELSKPVYYAGEMVEGFVYINAKSDRPYSSVYIRLSGREYVRWSTGSGKNRRTHSNTRDTYTEEFILASFGGTVQAGHYTFPFGFLLPQAMSGSFEQSACNYITYTLMAYLASKDGKNDNQMVVLRMNIKEPIRSPVSPSETTVSLSPQCCGCIGYGAFTLSLKVSTNLIKNGDVVSLSGNVDGSQSNGQLKGVNVCLRENYMMVSSGGLTRTWNQTHQLGVIVPQLPKGQSTPFTLAAKIPQEITGYTAIGAITARYYTLVLTGEVGCCTTDPAAIIHVIMDTTTPAIQKYPQISAPSNWNPLVAQKIVYNNMKPFMYQPVVNIPFHNQTGTMVQQQQGVQPQFSGNQYDNSNNYVQNNNNTHDKYSDREFNQGPTDS